MAEAPSRTQRRHVREKATIDHLVQEVYEPKTPDEKHTERSNSPSRRKRVAIARRIDATKKKVGSQQYRIRPKTSLELNR